MTSPALLARVLGERRRLRGREQWTPDQILVLPAVEGAVPVHPVLFHRLLELADAAALQVRQDGDGLTVLLAAPGPGIDRPRPHADLSGPLTAVGSTAVVRVQVVDAIPPGAAGKRPMVVSGSPTP